MEHAPLLGLRSTPPHGLHLEVVSSYTSLFVAFSTKKKKNAACPSFHSAKDRRKIRHSLHLVLRVRKHIFPHSRIFRSRWCEAFAPQTAKHFQNEHIIQIPSTPWNTPLSWVYWVQGTHRHMGPEDALLGGTRRSTGSTEHASTWAPFVGGELLQRP